MEIQSVFDPAFSEYGKVVTGFDFGNMISVLKEKTEKPSDRVIYVPGDEVLEKLPEARELSDNIYGGMPIQVGYCNGNNRMLNCLEYHRNSEIDIAADDIILLVASLKKVRDGKLDTKEVEAFKAPAGTAVQLYETTLHYAPCTASGNGFQVIIVLPKGTNTGKPDIKVKCGEDRLLWARNKWLIAHPDSAEAAQGAFAGLEGKNIAV